MNKHRPERMASSLNILLDGFFYNSHGLAEGNRLLLQILDHAGYRVRILPRDQSHKKDSVLPPKEIKYISSFEETKLSSNDIYLFNWWVGGARYRPDFRINIANTTFETDRLAQTWVRRLNHFDEVWVYCTFNRTTFASSGVKKPIRVIPHFIDMKQFAPQGDQLPLPVPQTYKFLSVFDLRPDNRKGSDVLLRAYLNEFSSKDDVCLVIKIRDRSATPKLKEIIDAHPKSTKNKPSIYIMDRMLPAAELLGLYRACDAFVLPTRGEGWGRPFFEVMLMEMPVLGTNWSGHTDFMKESNAYLIDVERLVQIKNNEMERHVFEHQEEAAEKGRKARSDLIHQYNMKDIANKVVREIEKYRR